MQPSVYASAACISQGTASVSCVLLPVPTLPPQPLNPISPAPPAPSTRTRYSRTYMGYRTKPPMKPWDRL